MNVGFLAIVKLLSYDIFFLAVVLGLVTILSSTRRAAYAVLKRNFFGYFSNPTGYVFLCLFVLLTSMAAFWPHSFFSDNIGSLAQLNKWFVYIMLFFIPAITMSIWAEERRQGTDELLLTLPADDFDIVIGKYSAAVAIFTTSLLFSQISNFIVLWSLTIGEVDTGLFFVNYLGYWFIGLAMIAIGMIASFLTNNLTVGFILGALFNAPLAFAQQSDVIIPSDVVARRSKSFSLLEQFDNFGRGVLSSASITFFVLIAVFGMYVCMVMVGKRHWSGGKDGNSMFLHYLVRTILIAIIVVAASGLLRNKDVFRFDATEGQVSSLSSTTRTTIRSLKPERPIEVDAFLSADVPEQYAKVKYEVISLLKEFESTAKRAGIKVNVRINGDIETRSEQEEFAKEQFGLQPRSVQVRERGVYADRSILMGAAFRSGLEKVVIPFFEPGVPVEYQLVQAMNTVSRSARKKLGILRTDAMVNGGFSPSTMQQMPRQPLLEDLDKQYEIVDVDATSPIDPSLYACLLAVQPSSLSPDQMINFVNAVESGIPTAIFEDPMPRAMSMPGTGEPKQAGNPMFGGGQQVPKGDIRPLWKLLQIDIPGKPSMATGGINPNLVWQRYNPYPMLQRLQDTSDLWLFVRDDPSTGFDGLSEESEITRGLEEVMFLYAGAIQPAPNATVSITPIVTTFENSGMIDFTDVDSNGQMAPSEQVRMLQGPATGSQTVAVLIQGEQVPEQPAAEGKPAVPGKKPLNVVYVADADFMSGVFVNIRNRAQDFGDLNFRMQNVTFALNIIDVLADELDYPKIRRHVPTYASLRLVEQQAEAQRTASANETLAFNEKYREELQSAEAELTKLAQEAQKQIDDLRSKGALTPADQKKLLAALQEFETKNALAKQRFEVKKQQLKTALEAKVAEVESKTDRSIREIENRYKMLAVFIPPIPPLLVGVVVLVSRRLREREGISKKRLK